MFPDITVDPYVWVWFGTTLGALFRWAYVPRKVGSYSMTTAQSEVSGNTSTQTQHRAATPQDALTLKAQYNRIADADKVFRNAARDLERALAPSSGLDDHDNIATLKQDLVDAASAYADALADGRQIIQDLPAGTSAPGGANRVTVVAELFGVVDSTMGRVMSAKDAAAANRRSFRSA